MEAWQAKAIMDAMVAGSMCGDQQANERAHRSLMAVLAR